MSNKIQILVLLVIFAGYLAYQYMLPVSVDPESAILAPGSTADKNEMLQNRTVAAEVPAAAVIEPTVVEVFPQPNEQELSARHAELTTLIQEYDQHLHDPKKQQEIKQRAAEVAESYKREVLAKVKSLQQNANPN